MTRCYWINNALVLIQARLSEYSQRNPWLTEIKRPPLQRKKERFWDHLALFLNAGSILPQLHYRRSLWISGSQLWKGRSYCTNHNVSMEKKLTSLVWFCSQRQSHVAQDSLELTQSWLWTPDRHVSTSQVLPSHPTQEMKFFMFNACVHLAFKKC